MKLPPFGKVICLAMGLYFGWGVYDELFGEKLFQPKALIGSIIGSVIFFALGFSAKPEKKRELPPESRASPPNDAAR